MQLHEAHVVNELTNYREVNMALQDGWKLLAVMSASSVTDPVRIQVHYVVGKPKDDGAPKPDGFTAA
ncbi:hypothetical protein [Pseudomonas sp. B28(2017)]|uniref:hypothetical protein n=1 Tax=Pseudomonas sp. B28(2017) TaxID=1981730 RepID=UPI000A1E8E2D|nr:hypothetical protein [Pseudomonas sp. B28(2017)]